MSHLDILKDQINAMENKIGQICQEMSDLENVINDFRNKKSEIENKLAISETRYVSLTNNFNYLSEVQKETLNNYKQIEDAATTLLDIIKSKCDNIA